MGSVTDRIQTKEGQELVGAGGVKGERSGIREELRGTLVM